MNKKTFPLLLATALALGACSTNDDVANENAERNPDNMIAFSSEDAIVKTRTGFTIADTKLGILFASTDGTNNKWSKTEATGAKNATEGATEYSQVTFADGNKRYWDDCFGRNAKLSVYAVAVPNKDGITLPIVGAAGWNDGAATTTFDWSVPENQSVSEMTDLDLTYSNNIQTTSWAKKGIYKYQWGAGEGYILKTEAEYGTETEGRLQFQAKNDGSESGKFNRGHLIFKHNLCWITVNLKEGTGFNNTSTDDFKFPTSGPNATLVNANQNGTFSLVSGTWTAKNAVNIAGLKDNSETKAAQTTYTLEAMTLPDKVLYGQVTDFLTFTIDGNLYHVSCDEVAKAIREKASTTLSDGALKTRLTSFENMTAGDHYTINITVGKTQIETVTAEVVQWEKVYADYTANNARIELTLRDDTHGEDITGDPTNKFAVYRALDNNAEATTIPADENAYAVYNWDQAYTKATTLEWNSTKHNYKTNWFWESNKHFYHLRTVNPKTTASLETGNKTFSMTSGAQGDVTDYQWGAPYYADGTKKLYYDVTKGFEYYKDGTTRQLFKAIGPTNSDIHMLIQHMMSDVNIELSTVEGSGAVNITGATVELLYFANTGTVNMGNGLITPTTTITPRQTITANGNTYTWRVVPQKLKRGDGNGEMVGIKVTTSDNNQYYLVKDLSTLKVKTVTDNGNNRYEDDNTIDRWYPGYSYTYNIKLSKTQIETVTAEIVKWESVTADKTVTLESKKARNWK